MFLVRSKSCITRKRKSTISTAKIVTRRSYWIYQNGFRPRCARYSWLWFFYMLFFFFLPPHVSCFIWTLDNANRRRFSFFHVYYCKCMDYLWKTLMQSTFHKDTYIVCQTIFYLYTSLQNAKYIKVSIKKKLKVECKILCKNYKQTRSEEA